MFFAALDADDGGAEEVPLVLLLALALPLGLGFPLGSDFVALDEDGG